MPSEKIEIIRMLNKRKSYLSSECFSESIYEATFQLRSGIKGNIFQETSENFLANVLLARISRIQSVEKNEDFENLYCLIEATRGLLNLKLETTAI